MMARLRQYFIAGLLVWLPIVITAWVLIWLVGMLDGIFASVMSAFGNVIEPLEPIARQLRRIPGLGVMAVLVGVAITGMAAANIVGQWWLRQWNRLVARIPVVRSLYSGVRQVSETLLSDGGQAFSRALLIQYPRPGLWTLAFVTGAPSGEVAERLAGDFISVYVPTTPNPTSGFLLLVPAADTIELHMSVDDALKYIISMGVIAPPKPHPFSLIEPEASLPPAPEHLH